GRQPTRLEHLRLEAYVGRVGALAPTIADVRRHDVEVAYVQGLEGPVVDVRDVAGANLEVIDLQRVDRFQRVLPAALLHRRGVVDLHARLRQVEVDGRVVILDVADSGTRQGRPTVAASPRA